MRIVLEILGRPADNVKDALNLLITKLSAEEGVAICEKIVHEPSLVKDTKDLYTSFAEITIEIKSIDLFFGILFAYMPSHVEILYPEKITFPNTVFNSAANQLIQRLHNYDAIVKKALFEKDAITKKLYEVAPQLFKAREPMPAPAHQQKKSKKTSLKVKKPKTNR